MVLREVLRTRARNRFDKKSQLSGMVSKKDWIINMSTCQRPRGNGEIANRTVKQILQIGLDKVMLGRSELLTGSGDHE